MALKRFHESTTAPLVRSGSRWKAVLITPGQGSSANYSEAALEASLPAFASGTKNFFMHPDSPGEQRDPRNQWGFIPESVSYEAGVGIVAEIEILPHWKDVIDSLAEAGQASLSIWATGEADEDGNLIALEANVQNSVDLISYPGRPGSGLTTKMYESAIAAYVPTNPGVEASAQEHQEEGHMDKQILEALTALAAKFDTFVAESKAASLDAVKAEADAKTADVAVEEALVAYDEKVAAIESAELLPSQVASLRVEAKAGRDVAPLIEAAKAVVAEFKVLAEAKGTDLNGRVLSENATDDYNVKGLNR